MKNKLAKIVAVLTVAGLMTAGSAAYAVSKEDNPENSKGPQLSADLGDMEKLNLTPEQRGKIIAEQTARQESGKVLREQFQKAWDMIYSVVAKPGTTRADVSGLTEEVSAIQVQMVARRVNRLFAMRDILTPEQFAKMLEIEWTGKKSEGGEEKSQEPAQS